MSKVASPIRQEFPRGEAVSFDPGGFDELISAQGVPLVHWRAMACPQGMTHRDDVTRHTHADHQGCSNGYLYRRSGVVSGVFAGNSGHREMMDPGNLDGSTAQVTFGRRYEDDPSRETQFRFADRLYFLDESVTWPMWELVQHDAAGRDRLRFPVARMLDLVDSRMIEYKDGEDFDLKDGQVWWRPGKAPGIDPDSGRGRVYVANYVYRPFWYVKSVDHAIRVVQAEGPDGVRRSARMPWAVTVVRETMFEDRARNDDLQSQETGRDQQSPEDGSFGPR